MPSNRFIGLAVLSMMLFTDGSPAADPTNEPQPDARIVLRISKDLIRKHVRPTIEQTTPIDQYVMGSHAVGTANTTGKIAVKLDARDTDSTFTIRLQGTTNTETVASRFPIHVFTSGTAQFDVKRIVQFDGTHFTAQPSSIEATYRSTLDGVGTPPGLRGCVVRGLATPIVRRQMPRSDALALDSTKTQILAQFNADSDKMVAELNRGLPVRETIESLAPATRDWITHLGSSPDFLIVSRGPKSAHIPELPAEATEMRAGVELWIHGKPQNTRMRKAVEIWTKAHQILDRLRPTKVKRPRQIEFEVVGEWLVLRVGEEMVDSWFDKMFQE